MGFIAVATGLQAEARICTGAGLQAFATGGDGTRMRAALEGAVAKGARGIVSFGIAGGLAPDLAPGDCVIARHVIAETVRYSTDATWTRRLSTALEQARLCDFAGLDHAVADTPAKRALFEITGAQVVDMESGVVARVAREHDLPFVALRIVADPHDRALPRAALVGLKRDGAPDVPAVIAALARDPRQLPALLRVARDTSLAMAALLRCYRRLGPGFSFGDLG